MDLHKIIDELNKERQRLERIITTLEELNGKEAVVPVVKRRGRKFMAPDDRKAVSLRMKRYWAAKKQQQDEEN
jgi:hypothetical protein